MSSTRLLRSGRDIHLDSVITRAANLTDELNAEQIALVEGGIKGWRLMRLERKIQRDTMRRGSARSFTISRRHPSNGKAGGEQSHIPNVSGSKISIDHKLIEGYQIPPLFSTGHQGVPKVDGSETPFLPSQDDDYADDDLQLDDFDLQLLAQSNKTAGRLNFSHTGGYSSYEPPQRGGQKHVSRLFHQSQVTPRRTFESSPSDIHASSSSSPLARLQSGKIRGRAQERDRQGQGVSQDHGPYGHESAETRFHLGSEWDLIDSHGQKNPFQNIPVSVRGIILLSVRELPDNYRSLFSFPVFNAVQSKCFYPIYKSDDNFVLSAPTGSGKTVVMELAICRLLNVLKDESFKVVYQAPTKSLCSERFRDWNRKFHFLGLLCAELTGDTDHTQLRHVQNSQIIITTPEKWDSMTRKWKDHARLMQLVKLFLIDEVHTLKEARGATLEAVVSRMKSIGSNVRFVALSATIPNSEDIATWLGRNATNQHVPAHREHFSEDFRPVRLQRHVYGYQSHGNDFAFDKMCNSKLPDVIATHSCNKPIMIFCCTRNSAVTTAKELSRLWSMSNPPLRLWKGPSKPIDALNVDLKATTSTGVGFHHAGLDSSDRHRVENGFLQGTISIICCTSTLAVGINLPCHLVIIKNTVGWQDGCCQEYSDLEIMQMLGRAGRPQFDDSATAVILTRKERVNHYEKLVSGGESLESCLHLNLIDHLNAEIGLGNVTCIESAIRWLAGTFLFVRLRRNPTHYQLKEGANKEDEDEMLRQICEKDVNLLKECGLVSSEVLRSTPFGDAMARYYIQFETMKTFLTLEPRSEISQILLVITKAEEFRDVRFKAGEKSLYKEINRSNGINFPVQVDIALPSHKTSLLIQSELGGVEFPAGEQFQKHKFTFQQDKNTVFSHVNRLIRCIIDCQIFLQDSKTVQNALELSRSLGARVWDKSPFQMKQIEQIGVVAVRKLAGAGINTIEALEDTDAHRIDMILSKNPPFGIKLLGRLSDFPKPRVSIKMTGKDIKPGTPVKVRFKAEIGFLNEKYPRFFQRQPIHLCFLAETSNGHLIDFRRMSANKIQNKLEIFLSAEMTHRDEYITCYVMCDDIAGTLRCATLKPEVSTLSFPPLSKVGLQARAIRKDEIQHTINDDTPTTSRVDPFDDDVVLFGRLLEAEQSPADTINTNHLPHAQCAYPTPGVAVKKGNARTGMIGQECAEIGKQSTQLANDRWTCNHKCKDKLNCKHSCCREGLKKPPKASKDRVNGDRQGGTRSNQLTFSASLAKSGVHTLPVVTDSSQEFRDIDAPSLCSAQSQLKDPQVPKPGEIIGVDNIPFSYSKGSLSDYGDENFDDIPSPSTWFFGDINQAASENSLKLDGGAKGHTGPSESWRSLLDTDDVSFLAQSPLAKSQENDECISGAYGVNAIPKSPQGARKAFTLEPQARHKFQEQERKRTFVNTKHSGSYKRVKSSEADQGHSPHMADKEQCDNKLMQKRDFQLLQMMLDAPSIPSDMEDIGPALLQEFMDVVDFF